MARIAQLLLLSVAVTLPLVGQAYDESTRKTLAGLQGVYVLVENITDEAHRDGLWRDQIQTDVELKLRQAGIPVLTRDQMVFAAGAPYLYVNAVTFKNSAGLYAV